MNHMWIDTSVDLNLCLFTEILLLYFHCPWLFSVTPLFNVDDAQTHTGCGTPFPISLLSMHDARPFSALNFQALLQFLSVLHDHLLPEQIPILQTSSHSFFSIRLHVLSCIMSFLVTLFHPFSPHKHTAAWIWLGSMLCITYMVPSELTGHCAVIWWNHFV
jgi:hypothetical protein